jgi:uncharacterized protein (UPF0335 family)
MSRTFLKKAEVKEVVADDSWKTFLATVTTTDITEKEFFESLQEAINGMKFEGFDWKKTMSTFMKLAKDAGREWVDDLALICAYYVTRGANTSTGRLDRLKPDWKTAMTEIVKIYKIPADSRPQKTDDITVARLVAAAPMFVARIMKAFDGVRVIGLDKIEEAKKIPRWLCFPQAAALIPSDYDELWANWSLWNESFSGIIKPVGDDKKRASDATTGQNMKFATYARESDMISTADRKKFLVSMGYLKAK